MRRLTIVMGLSLIGFVFAACGPSNGKKLTELNESQAERTCNNADNQASECEDFEPTPDEVDCSDYHDEITSELPEKCPATVGDLKSCAQNCGSSDNVGCQAIQNCTTGP